jgi:hypothetical protein
MKEPICLCRRCADDYRYAGYKLIPDYSVTEKEPCEKCGRLGFIYLIERKRDGKGKDGYKPT